MRTVHGIYSYLTGNLYYFFDLNEDLAEIHEHVSRTKITQDFTYVVKVKKDGEIEFVPKPKLWIKRNLVAKIPVSTPEKIPLTSDDVIKLIYDLDLDPFVYIVDVDKFYHHTTIEIYDAEKPFVLNMYPFMRYNNYEIFAIDKNEFEIHNFEIKSSYKDSVRIGNDVFLFNFADREYTAPVSLYDYINTVTLVVDTTPLGEVVFSPLKIDTFDLRKKYSFTDPYLIFATLYKPL